MLYEFNDDLVLDHRGWWFVWDAAWDSFRPIDNIQWDGSKFTYDDRQYCSDPTDPTYGYGSEMMKELCEILGDQRHDMPVVSNFIPIGTPAWFFDRPVGLTPCAPRTHASWKRMVRGHHRTCRRAPKGKKFTRRVWD